jgi:phosphoribosylamine---glycine ligase
MPAPTEGGALVTDGGRVLGITAVGPAAEVARDRAYRAAARIKWPGVHSCRDTSARPRLSPNPAEPDPRR